MNGLLTAALLACPGFHPQEKPAQAHPKVDQKRVNEAIEKGVAWLRKADRSQVYGSTELTLWTLLHAGVPETDALFKQLLAEVLGLEPYSTYAVSLQAMILEELDRVKHQRRIAQCAQFLVDNQSSKGWWGYGKPTPFVDQIPAPTAGTRRREVATPGTKPKKGEPPVRLKPPVLQTIQIKKKRDGDPHDNSNSQYAALGLRACHDAGIVFEKQVIELARKWWVESAHAEQNSKEGYPPMGWGYTERGCNPTGCGAMTAGAVGALVIYDYMLDENAQKSLPWKRDPAVMGGMNWLAKNFTVTKNAGWCDVGGEPGPHYYYLYALERAGVLYGTEWIGKHEWYPEGANLLLQSQKGDGSWGGVNTWDAHSDTCFAILFLRRATRRLTDVATVDRLTGK